MEQCQIGRELMCNRYLVLIAWNANRSGSFESSGRLQEFERVIFKVS